MQIGSSRMWCSQCNMVQWFDVHQLMKSVGVIPAEDVPDIELSPVVLCWVCRQALTSQTKIAVAVARMTTHRLVL